MPDDPVPTPTPEPTPNPTPTPEPTPDPSLDPQQPGSQSVKVDHQTAPAPQPKPDPGDFLAMIPEAYKDKPYMKEVDSVDKLFKDFDNAQSLIGQRQAEIPKADASLEEINAYLDKIRPESTEVYELPETEYSKKFGRDEEFGKAMKDLFHKAGLQPWQAKMLAEGYDGVALEKVGAQAQTVEQQAADFEKLADGHFGEEKEQKLKIANEILRANTPDAFKDHLQNLSNENLMIMSAVLNQVYDKFMKEDDLNLGGKGTGTDAAGLQEEARQLMASPSYKDFRHPQHESTVKKVNELYDQIAAVNQKK